MSAFSAAAVGTLDYDFTQIPREDGLGLGTAKGIVAEPTLARVEAFYDAFNALHETAGADAETIAQGEQANQLRKIIADLCNGSPTLEDISFLPPRYLGAFAKWLLGEIIDPKG